MIAQLPQPFLPGVMTSSQKSKIEYWAGYTFGWPSCLEGISKWVSGCVVTPRWQNRAGQELETWRPIMLDNGAFSAWLNDQPISLKSQVEAMRSFMDTLPDHSIEWIVLPDVVADGMESWRRSWHGIGMLQDLIHPERMLWPVQEEMDIYQLAAMWRAGAFGGFFVGGKTRRWKLETAREIRKELSSAYIHIGRISSPHHLMAATQIPIDSFDTTSFTRQQEWNRSQPYAARLAMFCKETA